MHDIDTALNVLKQRGASELAIKKYTEALEIHQLLNPESEPSRRENLNRRINQQVTETTMIRINTNEKSIVHEGSGSESSDSEGQY